MIVTGLLTKAKKLDNYEADATGATAQWPDTTHYRATVPANKRWFLTGGVCYRDANASLNVYLRNLSDQLIGHIATHAAAVGHATYPLAAQAGTQVFPFVLNAGDYVECTFGAAQGVGAYGVANVLEVDFD